MYVESSKFYAFSFCSFCHPLYEVSKDQCYMMRCDITYDYKQCSSSNRSISFYKVTLFLMPTEHSLHQVICIWQKKFNQFCLNMFHN